MVLSASSTLNNNVMDMVKSAAARTDEFLRQWLEDVHDAPSLLRESIAYSLFGPGKRIRPALALLSCRAVGGDENLALPAAGALELIHCFSLVHDDLPAMDNDDLRRGRPTNHKIYGDAVAILAGDAMNTMAFELLASRVPDAILALRLVKELGHAIGAAGMIGGQILDTCYPKEKSHGNQGGLEHLQRIHRMKTGALINAACRMGALCGGVTENDLQTIDALGRAIGLAFQIVDDLLDATSTAENLGKKTGKDAAIGKLTYPSLLGVEKSREHLARQQEIAKTMAARLGPPAEPLAQLVVELARRDH
ncbi:MAG: polyprenyl synthetase family protein [Planctomycetia bacterium]|nr:polyprenyl synthetase family protein [Planctomycetia bacterium]